MARARGLLLAAVAAAAVAGCGGGTKHAAAPTTTAAAKGSCTHVAKPAARPSGGRKAPTAILDATKTYDAVVDTNCGTFTIRLDVKHAPHTVASFVALARAGFYDGLIFHRIVPGFVIQGGDPTGSGAGGPGYLTVDPPRAGTRYVHGVVAMAKTQTQPAGTAGSQFFVVTGLDAQLPPLYAVLGHVTKGLAVADRIGRLGDPTTEQPTQVIEIRHVAVRVS